MMKSQAFRVFLRLLPLLVAVPLIYFMWFSGGGDRLQQSVTNVNTVASNLKGKEAPDFHFAKAMSWRGQELDLHTLKGKPVVLHFWATWCGPCVMEMPELLELAGQRKDMTFITIAIDNNWQTVSSFFERYTKLKKFPELTDLYLDPDGAIPARYGSNGLPETFLIDAKQVVTAKLVGPQPWLEKGMKPLLDSLIHQN